MKVSVNKITFLGDRVSWDLSGKIASAVMTGRGIQTGIICMAGDAMLYHSAESFAASAFAAILSPGASRTVEYLALRNVFGDEFVKHKSIDTTPDAALPANLDQFSLAARSITAGYAIGGVALTAFTAWFGLEGHSAAPVLVMAPIVVRTAMGTYRWANVTQGAYRIDDKGPPQDPVRHKTKTHIGLAGPRLAGS